MQQPYGVSFPLNGGVLAIAELQFAYPGSGTLVKAGEDEPLARTYKIGVWYDSESFADLRYDNTGLSLASPAQQRDPASHRGDYAIYAVADQMIWRCRRSPTATSTSSSGRCSRRCRTAISSTSASTPA